VQIPSHHLNEPKDLYRDYKAEIKKAANPQKESFKFQNSKQTSLKQLRPIIDEGLNERG